MFFTSVQYYIFFPIIFLIVYFAENGWRWLVLLLASVYFYYSLDVPYLLLILFLVIVITYTVSLLLEKTEHNGNKRALFLFGIALNLSILLIVKYLPFLTKSINDLFVIIKWDRSLPISQQLFSVGVSFYVFQAISYLADIYTKKEKPEKHFGYFSLYLSFFPKLLSGPIERASNLLPQLHSRYSFDYDNIRCGLLMIAGGLFKKVVIADRLALYVNPVYNNVNDYSGIAFIIATYLYALQLYFDFSGYTDIALGTARIFNIRLTQNFNSPYLSTSISDFWRRWHISLSSWFRDYLYIPLGGNRVGTVRRCYNLLIVFFLCGLWHGDSWSFIVWGLLHGVYLATSVIVKPIKETIHGKIGLENTWILKVWQWFITFNLVCFAWIFFRANTINDAWHIITHMISGTEGVKSLLLSQGTGELVVTIVCLMVMTIPLLLRNKMDSYNYILGKPLLIRWSVYFIIVLNISIFGLFNSNQTFAYFNF